MLIDYENVDVYQEDNCVLKDVNFHVDEGEFIYIIGIRIFIFIFKISTRLHQLINYEYLFKLI